MRAFVTVGGYDFPEPSTYDSSTSTLVNSGRNVKGVQVGSVIREDVAKVTLSWRYLTAKQWSDINKCFLSKYGGSFYNNVTFFNQDSARWETRKMYVGDRTAGVFRRDPKTGEVLGYVGSKLSLIEV